MKRKFKQLIVTSINKTKNHLKHPNNQKRTMAYGVWNRVPGLGQAQKCARCINYKIYLILLFEMLTSVFAL
jgi:hypothetical protein